MVNAGAVAPDPNVRDLPLMADPTDFEAQVLPHLDTMYRVGRRLTGETADAEDLVQETLLKAWRGWAGFTPGSNVRAWLLTILRNAFISRWRSRKHEGTAISLDDADPHAIYRAVGGEDPEGSFFEKVVDEKVLAAVEALPAEFREAVVLSDIEGLPYAEVAAILSVPVGTIKSRLFRARRQLQKTLHDHAVAVGILKGPR
jgi:RNA polymerase sigma-70 factor (ECF subfamily)